MYVITNGEVFISNKDSIHVVSNLEEASKFKITKANNIINILPKKSRKYNWEIRFAKVERGLIVELAKNKELDYDLNNEIIKIEKFARDLEEREIYLIEQLQKIELQKVDLEHYFEFQDLNMYKAWKFYKLFQSLMRERRNIKDEIAKINYILKSTMKNDMIPLKQTR